MEVKIEISCWSLPESRGRSLRPAISLAGAASPRAELPLRSRAHLAMTLVYEVGSGVGLVCGSGVGTYGCFYKFGVLLDVVSGLVLMAVPINSGSF